MATILVIDDNRMVAQLVTHALKPQGYDLDIAVNGAEGIEKAIGSEPDLVLLDYMLPDMDGLTVLRDIHEKKPKLPVIMITGSDDDNVSQSASQYDVKGFVSKPFDIARLIEIVGKIVPPPGK